MKNPTKKEHVAAHGNIQDRVNAAAKCLSGLKLTVPFLLDGMDYKAQKD